jgi:hypothetical protein
MQRELVGSGHLGHGRGLVHTALLVTALGVAAVIVGWVAYLVLVASIILWG